MEEHIVLAVPFLAGIANASLISYYGNNFVPTDVDPQHGTLSGTSGSALTNLSAVTLGLQAAVALRYGWISIRQSSTAKQLDRHSWFSLAMTFFMLLSMTLCVMNVVMVTEWSNVPVVVSVQRRLGGTYGTSLMSLDYGTLGVGLVVTTLYFVCGYQKNLVVSLLP
jgi:hypothetical protein